MPTLGVTTGSAAVPSQSHETDILRITLTKAIFLPKWSTTALEDSVILSINSSLAISHWLVEPGVV